MLGTVFGDGDVSVAVTGQLECLIPSFPLGGVFLPISLSIFCKSEGGVARTWSTFICTIFSKKYFFPLPLFQRTSSLRMQVTQDGIVMRFFLKGVGCDEQGQRDRWSTIGGEKMEGHFR